MPNDLYLHSSSFVFCWERLILSRTGWMVIPVGGQTFTDHTLYTLDWLEQFNTGQ